MDSVFLIDGGFFSRRIKDSLNRISQPQDVSDFVNAVRKKHDGQYRLLRIYYYDSPPSNAKAVTPILRSPIDFGASAQFKHQSKLLSDLKRMDYVSVREGRVAFRGWALKKGLLLSPPSTPSDNDYRPDFEQKGVDTKIGLDMAWISMGRIAQRIYLVTGDSDFIPAMKFARRSGIQVFLYTLAHGVTDEMKDHSDVLVEDSIKSIVASPTPSSALASTA